MVYGFLFVVGVGKIVNNNQLFIMKYVIKIDFMIYDYENG